MDNYSKFVFSVIAVALVLIAVKLWEPRNSEAELLTNFPTYGEYKATFKIKKPNLQTQAIEELKARMPIVYVMGGHVNAR